MAGTWISSKNYAFDRGVPVPGAIAQFYQASTLTPMVVYVDYGLTTPAGSFVVANGNGQWPVVYLDEGPGFYRYRTIKPDGSILDDLTTLAIIGPGMGSGGGGGTPVDTTQLLKTGFFMWYPSPVPVEGWVRANSLTIGSAGSVGSERHNADCQALFTFLYTYFLDWACPVTPGGRGANALDDWNANKAIATPDLRGRGVFGVDTMGAAAPAGRLTTASVVLPNDVGLTGGVETVTLTAAQLPVHAHSVGALSLATGTESALHYHGLNIALTAQPPATPGATFAVVQPNGFGFAAASTYEAQTHAHSVDIPATSTGSVGGGGVVSTMPPFMIGTWLVKL